MDTLKSKDRGIVSINEALMKIAGIEQVVMQMGANDYEPAAFASLKEGVRNGSITPEDAIKQAHEIQSSKQDYH